jgi:hypothetical protein
MDRSFTKGRRCSFPASVATVPECSFDLRKQPKPLVAMQTSSNKVRTTRFWIFLDQGS